MGSQRVRHDWVREARLHQAGGRGWQVEVGGNWYSGVVVSRPTSWKRGERRVQCSSLRRAGPAVQAQASQFPWLSSQGQVEKRAQGARTSASMSLGWPGDSLPGGSRRQEWGIWGFNLSLLWFRGPLVPLWFLEPKPHQGDYLLPSDIQGCSLLTEIIETKAHFSEASPPVLLVGWWRKHCRWVEVWGGNLRANRVQKGAEPQVCEASSCSRGSQS